MPKSTFYKIAAEKQERILLAAREEFLSVPYNQASINKIIKAAGIPRGSFYQYFEDKKDLFLYFIEVNKNEIFRFFNGKLQELKGDLFASLEYCIAKLLSEDMEAELRNTLVIFSEPEFFEMLWEEGCESDPANKEVEQAILASVDIKLLDVDNSQEFIVLMSIIGDVICNGVIRIAAQKDEETRKEVHQLMVAQLKLLKKKYGK